MGGLRLRSIHRFLVPFLLAPTVLGAQDRRAPEGPAGYEVGWHIVRPGETLQGLAARFLGSPAAWPQIHRLNEAILDANRIEPGQRIRIPVRQQGGPPAAKVNRVSRRVEEQPAPIPWSDAQVGDLLVEDDGLRTHRKSSAEMQFTDGTQLRLTEDSLVFLRRSGGALRGVEKKTVEIVDGQADLETRPSPTRPTAGRPEVEIILGATRATSKPSPSGAAQARARRPTEGGAKVMVYGGEGEVEAGGAKVQVAEGMGTSVPQQGPPSPPERLLPAARPAAPAPGSQVACATPLFSWGPVPEAESYVVEVCRDPACAELVDRATGVAGAEWRPTAPLALGAYHWRVTARSRTGLDGYPGEAAGLSITAAQAEAKPPADAALQVVGTQVRLDDKLYVNGGVRVEVATEGTGSAGIRWRPAVDGQEAAAWPTAWTGGERTVSAVATDDCGQAVRLAPVTFIVDDAPPVLRWEAGDAARFEESLTPEEAVVLSRRRSRREREESRRPMPLAWSSGGVRWFPLAIRGEDGEQVLAEVRIASDTPRVFFRTQGLGLVADGTPVPLGEGRLLSVSAEDAGSRVEHMILRTRSTPAGLVLEVEAVDLVGNTSKREWLLR